MKINDIPFQIYYQIDSISKTCSRIDALIGMALIVFSLIFIPRLYNTAEKTYLNTGLYVLGETFATKFNQLRKELDKEAESLGLSTLSINLIDQKGRNVYGFSTGYIYSKEFTYAQITIKSGPFEFGSNLHVSISTMPKKPDTEAKIEKILKEKYTDTARYSTQDILRQFDNYERLNAPKIGIYGVSIESKILPVIMLCLVLLCIHYIKDYGSRVAWLKEYDELEDAEKNAILLEVISFPAIDTYKERIFFPLRKLFLISISAAYVFFAVLSSADPRWLSNDNGPAVIFKSGVFTSILVEGAIIIFSLFILAKAYKSTLHNNAIQPTDSVASAPSEAADG